MIVLGSNVAWTSAANGTWKEKIGRVVYVVPAGMHLCWQEVNHIVAELGGNISTSGMENSGRRDHESYLVLVDQGSKRKAKIYWPRVATLKEVKPL